MAIFTLPQNLNGVQLQKELKDAEIVLNDYPRITDEGLFLDIKKADEVKAKVIVDNHIGKEIKETIFEKIESLGITIDELKLALGI